MSMKKIIYLLLILNLGLLSCVDDASVRVMPEFNCKDTKVNLAKAAGSSVTSLLYTNVGQVVAQYDATQHLPLSQAKAGDLVFFHSTYNAGSYVTHVGILVSPTQMYHAGNPIGYADLNSSYWQQHLIGAGRVKQ